MPGIVDDLSDLFPHTLTAQPVTVDHTGAESANGTALGLPAYIVGSNRMVRDSRGQEQVSSVRATLGITDAQVDAWIALGWEGWIDPDWISGDTDTLPTFLTVATYRFTLPPDFDPRGNENGELGFKAIRIGSIPDEDGAHHQVVYLP